MARNKEFRKATYLELPRCYDASTAHAGQWAGYFGSSRPLTLELGCGKADFSTEMALKYPERNFLGIDLKPARLFYPGRRIQEEGIPNLALLAAHLLELPRHVAPAEASEIWITFPDPFPKKRQAKHRMINPPFLRIYREALQPGGTLHFKTDNRELFLYALEVFVQQDQVEFTYLTFDLHADAGAPADARILTAYERLFMAEGKQINYVSFRFR
jgi:tRNA (guanine-N7-)-methyltransferase